MKSITMIIPTRGRREKLHRTLQSLPCMENLVVHVVSDGDQDVMSLRSKDYNVPVAFELLDGHNGSVFCRNYATAKVEDGVMCAMDDVEFESGCIESAFECFNKHFPEDDGVVGFVQTEHKFHPTWIALVGQKFLSRYPQKHLFYSGYYHFASQEILELCTQLENKFVQCNEARVKHYHPGFVKQEMDETHRTARVRLAADRDLREYRKHEGLIWGM